LVLGGSTSGGNNKKRNTKTTKREAQKTSKQRQTKINLLLRVRVLQSLMVVLL